MSETVDSADLQLNDETLALVDGWLGLAPGSTTSVSIPEPPTTRNGRLGLGAKYIPHKPTAATSDKIEAKLKQKLKRKRKGNEFDDDEQEEANKNVQVASDSEDEGRGKSTNGKKSVTDMFDLVSAADKKKLTKGERKRRKKEREAAALVSSDAESVVLFSTTAKNDNDKEEVVGDSKAVEVVAPIKEQIETVIEKVDIVPQKEEKEEGVVDSVEEQEEVVAKEAEVPVPVEGEKKRRKKKKTKKEHTEQVGQQQKIIVIGDNAPISITQHDTPTESIVTPVSESSITSIINNEAIMEVTDDQPMKRKRDEEANEGNDTSVKKKKKKSKSKANQSTAVVDIVVKDTHEEENLKPTELSLKKLKKKKKTPVSVKEEKVEKEDDTASTDQSVPSFWIDTFPEPPVLTDDLEASMSKNATFFSSNAKAFTLGELETDAPEPEKQSKPKKKKKNKKMGHKTTVVANDNESADADPAMPSFWSDDFPTPTSLPEDMMKSMNEHAGFFAQPPRQVNETDLADTTPGQSVLKAQSNATKSKLDQAVPMKNGKEGDAGLMKWGHGTKLKTKKRSKQKNIRKDNRPLDK
eukprot:Ihof_evm6s122 gene=Ihof_evmTU6s122